MNTNHQKNKRNSDANRLVSIGMPVFNGELFVEKALESLLSQSFHDFEVIISDNASSDRTEEICRAFAKADARIRFYRNTENMGAAQNYNRVFELSRGEFFKWQAVDDKCQPEFLSRCVEVLQEHPEVVLAYTKTFVTDLEDNIIEMEDVPLRFDAEDVIERFSCALNAIAYTDISIFGLIRRDILAKTRLIGRYLASDRCLIAELTLYGPFFRVDEPLFYRRKHAGNVGTSRENLSFYDPKLKGRVVFPAWRILREQLATIVRSPVGPRSTLRLIARLMHWAYQKRRTFAWQLKDGFTQFLNTSKNG